MRRRNPKRRKLYTAGKKLALKRLGVKRLGPTKAQRRTSIELSKQMFGYEPARLSRQVGNPSRYKRRGVRRITDTEGNIIREEFVAKRVSKSRRGKGGGGERADHRTGSAAARVSRSKKVGGKKGMKARREKKKGKKKKKKR